MKDTDKGLITHQLTLHMAKEGQHKFEYMICDNFGFNYTEQLIVKAEKS